MAVRIRLRRIGKKKQPQYRLVVAESAGPRDGRFIETIGHYNPRLDPAQISVNSDRALWWLERGARPSDTARSMLKKVGVWEKFGGEPSVVKRDEGSSDSGSVIDDIAEKQPEVVAESESAEAESETEEEEADSGVEATSDSDKVNE